MCVCIIKGQQGNPSTHGDHITAPFCARKTSMPKTENALHCLEEATAAIGVEKSSVYRSYSNQPIPAQTFFNGLIYFKTHHWKR